MKGIILAGGAGSRLYPMTQVVTKQLQPLYDKPMIYYPLSLLMLGGVSEILIITTPYDMPFFKKLLGNGERFGIKLEYAEQAEPKGIPEAFIIGEKFIGKDDVILILGDNLFYGDIDFFRKAIDAQKLKTGRIEARIFAYSVSDPERYGVVEFDEKKGKILSLEEKPAVPKSSFAIPGLYFFPPSVVSKAKLLKASDRGETEITELIKQYWKEETLGVERITRGVAWLDTGTPQALLAASSYIGAIEERQGLKVGCLEEVALRMGYLNREEFQKVIGELPKSPYRQYLQKLALEFRD